MRPFHRLRSVTPATAAVALAALAAATGACLVTTGALEDARAATALRDAKANTAVWAGSTDLTKLTIGDGKVTTSAPRRGWVYACTRPTGTSGGIPGVTKPWIHGSTWNFYEKAQVSGSVDWPSTLTARVSGGQRILQGNGLPKHVTGTYPVQQSDDAARYDPNPNSIQRFTINLALPVAPRASSSPNCLTMGPIGVMTSGATLFNALDAGGLDAPARELQDGCSGHPQQQGTYHYHALPACIYSGPAGEPSRVIGWAIDGYPITGPRGPRGVTYTNAMLDSCHGTTSRIKIGGTWKRTYHYVATMEFPYTIGCLHGTSQVSSGGAAQ